MKIIISGHHVEITEGINQAVENKFAKDDPRNLNRAKFIQK